jgi:hypothetical protein
LVAESVGRQRSHFIWDIERTGETRVGDAWERAGLYMCRTCKQFTLRMIVTQAGDGSGIVQQIERLPFGTAKPMVGVPSLIGSDRNEAWSAFHGSLFKGAALLARSSLETAVKGGATGTDLKGKIKNLSEGGTITTDLAAWADAVRITGNEAANEMGPVTEEDANDSLFFLDAFLDAVYAVPHRHRERKAQREAKAAEVIKDSSSDGPPV